MPSSQERRPHWTSEPRPSPQGDPRDWLRDGLKDPVSREDQISGGALQDDCHELTGEQSMRELPRADVKASRSLA